jgi:hypothetical protein
MGRRRKVFGGDGNDLLQDAALIGTGAYLARQNPDSSVFGVIGIAAKYFAYFIIGLLLFFFIFIIIAMIFGKKTQPPPADSTNSASGVPKK